MKKKNEDEKYELLFYILSEVHVLYAKTSIFLRFKCEKIFLISLMVGKIWLNKVVWKLQKMPQNSRFSVFSDNFDKLYLPNH